MRVISLILILIGGLTLGYRGFESQLRNAAPSALTRAEGAPDPWWRLSPVAGGIALVSGLLLLASTGRRDDR